MRWGPQLRAQRGPLALAGAVLTVLLVLAVIAARTRNSIPGLEPAPYRVRQNLEITVPDIPEAREWLEKYFNRTGPQEANGQRQLPQGRSWLQQAIKSLTTVCGQPLGRSDSPSRYLLLATVGDNWNASSWLSQPKYSTFDVAVIYYGTREDYTCELCSDVFRMRGPKWYLYYDLTTSPQWESIVQRGYKYIMLPDDDLIMDTCQINTFFSIMEEFEALMGQPSVCEKEGSYTWWPFLYQRPQHRVRFTTFMEIMAPTFRMDLYQALVRHTLKGTYTGYGLDLVWPALLKYPEDKIAVVDQICMVHPPSPPGGKPGGLYEVTNTLKQSDGNEMDMVLEHFNYKPEVIERMGMEYRAMKSLKVVTNDAASGAVADMEQHMQRDAIYQVVVVFQGVALAVLLLVLGIQRVRSMLRLGPGILPSNSQEWKLAAFRLKYAHR